MIQNSYKDLGEVIGYASQGAQIFLFFIMVLYLVYAFVLIRRVKLMNTNLNTPYKSVFTLGAWLHFFALVAVIFLTFLSLNK